MTYTPVTSFRRSLSAADLAPQRDAPQSLLNPSISKWDVLKELGTARSAYGLSDRDITVLQALLSFHKGSALDIRADQLIVFPSNKKICERLNGMPCSTMRRHLGKLVTAGFLTRRDSPNGKRYVRTRGDLRMAFGFDLSPLINRFVEICEAATSIREQQARLKDMREEVSLMRRDLIGMAELGADQQPDVGLWDALNDLAILSARTLRRKLCEADLRDLKTSLASALEQANAGLKELVETQEMSTSDASNEQHQYTSILKDSESMAQVSIEACDNPQRNPRSTNSESSKNKDQPNHLDVSFDEVEEACSEMQQFSERPIQSWSDLEITAETVRPMMGISSEVWQLAKQHIGGAESAIVLAVMLQNFSNYRSPGAYLRTLTNRAIEGRFSCALMLTGSQRRAA
ncbi:MAG: replication initiation protein [Cognatishimia sp.]|uniref:plasmid replication protein RepC n=1 Tax=Cognatishimia sp. TaxID=2211648 RepID=UPI003B8B878F